MGDCRAYDDVDEITAAYAVAFDPSGERIFAGYNKVMRLFDVSRPGRDCKRVNTHQKRGDASLPGERSQGRNPSMTCYL